MKVTQTGCIVYSRYEWESKGQYLFRHNKPKKDVNNTYVQDHTITFDVPDCFNAVPGQVAALKEVEQELRAKFAASLIEIQDKISKLTCITMDVQS